MKRTLFAAAFFAAALSGMASEQVYGPEKIQGGKLGNGMELILFRTPGAMSASFCLCFRGGSLGEGPGLRGASKLLEKLAFKGTPSVGTRDWRKEGLIFAELQKIGDEITERQKRNDPDTAGTDALISKALQLKARLGELYVPGAMSGRLASFGARDVFAHSSPDFFEVGMTLPKESLEEAFKLESDWLREPVFRDYYEERAAVKAAHGPVNAVPGSELYIGVLEKTLGARTATRPLWEGTDEVGWITLADFRRFAREALEPSRAVIVVVGDFTFTEISGMAEAYFGSVPSAKEKAGAGGGEAGGSAAEASASSAAHAIVAFRKDKADPATDAYLDLAVSRLSIGTPPEMLRALSAHAESGGCVNGDPGSVPPNLFLARIRLKQGADPSAAEKALADYLRTLHHKPVDAKTFETSKKALLFNISRAMENRVQLARFIGEGYLQSGAERYFLDYRVAVEKATPAGYAAALRSFFGGKE